MAISSNNYVQSSKFSIILQIQIIALYQLVPAPLDPSEKQILIEFFNANRGNSWTTKWNLSTDPCNGWFGITCNINKTSVDEMLNPFIFWKFAHWLS